MQRFLLVIMLSGSWLTTAHAQFPGIPSRPPILIPDDDKFPSAAGPRIGLTLLGPRMVDSLEVRYDRHVSPLISQFGWQLERQFATGRGMTGVTETVLLLAGAEQGLFLPSLTFLVGVRSRGGWEIGAGPNIARLGPGLALAAGRTFPVGQLTMPLTVAAVSSPMGVRYSVLSGFSINFPTP